MRSRDGANLRFTTNDANRIYTDWTEGYDEESEKQAPLVPLEANIYLENPTKSDVKTAFEEVHKILSNYSQGTTGIDIYFAGHGQYPTGSLVFKDGILSAEELLDWMSVPLKSNEGSRGISLFLDSCYSGSFLIDTIVELRNHAYHISLYDSFISSLHDEKSWELSFLAHGAFTFSYLNQGNDYVFFDTEYNFVPMNLSRAIEKNDHKIIARCLQYAVRSCGGSSVAYLTQARQHSIDLCNGHHFDVQGYGSFSYAHDLEGEITRELLIENIEKAKNVIWDDDWKPGSEWKK